MWTVTRSSYMPSKVEVTREGCLWSVRGGFVLSLRASELVHRPGGKGWLVPEQAVDLGTLLEAMWRVRLESPCLGIRA